MRKITEFFFLLEEDEELSLHDSLWFFGTLIGATIWTSFLVIVTW